MKKHTCYLCGGKDHETVKGAVALGVQSEHQRCLKCGAEWFDGRQARVASEKMGAVIKKRDHEA